MLDKSYICLILFTSTSLSISKVLPISSNQKPMSVLIFLFLIKTPTFIKFLIYSIIIFLKRGILIKVSFYNIFPVFGSLN